MVSTSAGAVRLILATLSLGGCGHLPEEATDRSREPTHATVEINGNPYRMPVALTAEGYALIEGDLIVANEDELRQRGLFIKEGTALWPKGIVSYKISSELPDKNRVLQAIAEWERRTQIRFVAAHATDDSYLLFKPAADPDNCSTSVGYTGKPQVLLLGSACQRGNVIHEIGHALGAAHEHMRSDQAQYITIVPANIRSGAKDNFEPKPRKYSDVGSYCYGSIMHYPRNAFSKNGRDTIIPRSTTAVIGQRTALAPCDVALIERMYRHEYQKR